MLQPTKQRNAIGKMRAALEERKAEERRVPEAVRRRRERGLSSSSPQNLWYGNLSKDCLWNKITRWHQTILLWRPQRAETHLLCSYEFSMRCQTWTVVVVTIPSRKIHKRKHKQPSPQSNHLMHPIVHQLQLGFLLLSNPSNLTLEIIATRECMIMDHFLLRERVESLHKLLVLSMQPRNRLISIWQKW